MVRRSETPDETKKRVINAARYLFVKQGYFNTTIPDIVKHSGVSIGSVYHHFGNKQNLAKYLYEQTLREFITVMENRLALQSTIEAKLRAIVKYLFEIADDNPVELEYMLFVKHEEIHSDFVPICISKPFLVVQELLHTGILKGQIKELPVEILGAGFMGVPLKIIELKLNRVITYPLMSRVDETFKICWDGVKK